ncbi:MAG: LysM peptidoglycan-binding domain-containing protein [Bacillota bacterium]|nr:LysM peptidoglycan-binding domain-containing protein [Bacillota bacterium]
MSEINNNYPFRQAPPPPPQCTGQIYTVVRGDTLFLISMRFGTPLASIIAANPQITNPDQIVPGQRICIPLPPTPAVCSGFLYTIVRGDTLAQISTRFGVRLVDIIIANPQIINPDVIFAGQVICIPIPPPADIECPGFLYTIQAGETLAILAQRFGITVQQIFAANPQILDPNRVFAGQTICIPAEAPTDDMNGVNGNGVNGNGTNGMNNNGGNNG